MRWRGSRLTFRRPGRPGPGRPRSRAAIGGDLAAEDGQHRRAALAGVELEDVVARHHRGIGGKITTYRRLAEHALERLAPHLPAPRPAWTGTAPLPGGDLATFPDFLADLMARRPWLPAALARRLSRAYGTRVERVLGDAGSMADLGEDLGAGLTGREVDYLVETEWAETAEDILWRRSKLGLHGGAALAQRLSSRLGAKTSFLPLQERSGLPQAGKERGRAGA